MQHTRFYARLLAVSTHVLQAALAQLESGDILSDILAEAMRPLHCRATIGAWWYLLEGLVFFMAAGQVWSCLLTRPMHHVTCMLMFLGCRRDHFLALHM